MSGSTNAVPKRQLTLLDCLGIGINGIVGSGIFLLPAAMWRRAGGMAPVSWLIVGGLCCLVALCFAEAAARTDRSGGPYRYASEAFGPYIGFAVGWVTLVSTVLGFAAVARGFGLQAMDLFHLGGRAGIDVWMSCGIVLVLCVINILGVRSSARTSDAISVVKIVSLLAFVGIGLFFIQLSNLKAGAHPRAGESTGLLAASFAGLFACTGFEYIPVPAGEAINPRRTMPLAMVISVLATIVLYALVQIVAGGVHPSLGDAESPLAAAAGQFGGSLGTRLMLMAGLLSAFGFCASSALVGPRYLESFAEDRFLPRALARRSPRWGTPALAVLTLSGLVFGLVFSRLPFESLADISNVVVVIQYMATCLAVLVLRRRAKAPEGAFVIPLGPVVPILALLGCLVFLFTGVNLVQFEWAAAMVGIGLVIGLPWRLASRRA